MEEIYWWHKKNITKCSHTPEVSHWNQKITLTNQQISLYQIDQVEKYQTYIQELMEEYVNSYDYDDVQVEKELLFDTMRHRYQIVNVGWQGEQRIYGCVLHIDIKDKKIWIQYDGTKINIAAQLMAKGVPKDDIVLGFRSGYKRQHSTGLAVN